MIIIILLTPGKSHSLLKKQRCLLAVGTTSRVVPKRILQRLSCGMNEFEPEINYRAARDAHLLLVAGSVDERSLPWRDAVCFAYLFFLWRYAAAILFCRSLIRRSHLLDALSPNDDMSRLILFRWAILSRHKITVFVLSIGSARVPQLVSDFLVFCCLTIVCWCCCSCRRACAKKGIGPLCRPLVSETNEGGVPSSAHFGTRSFQKCILVVNHIYTPRMNSLASAEDGRRNNKQIQNNCYNMRIETSPFWHPILLSFLEWFQIRHITMFNNPLALPGQAAAALGCILRAMHDGEWYPDCTTF